jgi:hypothetical protein
MHTVCSIPFTLTLCSAFACIYVRACDLYTYIYTYIVCVCVELVQETQVTQHLYGQVLYVYIHAYSHQQQHIYVCIYMYQHMHCVSLVTSGPACVLGPKQLPAHGVYIYIYYYVYVYKDTERFSHLTHCTRSPMCVSFYLIHGLTNLELFSSEFGAYVYHTHMTHPKV